MILPKREMEILRLIADGVRVPDMIARLHLSETTIKTYKERLYQRLHAVSAPNAVDLAHRRGILTLDPDVAEAAELISSATELGYTVTLTPRVRS